MAVLHWQALDCWHTIPYIGTCIENRLKSENMIMRHEVILSIVIHFSGLRQSFSICEGQGAGGISRAGQADLPVGCEHTDSSDRLQ